MECVSSNISIKAADIDIPGFLCNPGGEGPFPAVLVFHGSDGFTPNHTEISKKISHEGYVTLALTWFGSRSVRSHWNEVRTADIFAGVSFLEKMDNVDSGKIGLIGFSRGGGLALIFGSLIPQTRCIVNYFGLTSWHGGLEELPHLPLNSFDHLDFVKNIKSPILSFHGEKDTIVPVVNTLDLDAACRKYNVEHNCNLYPELEHSFIWPGDRYNREAHNESWNKSMDFFRLNLKD